MLNNAQMVAVKEFIEKNDVGVREALAQLFPEYDTSKQNIKDTQDALFGKFPNLKTKIVQSRLKKADRKGR
jgi:hypothetical protein